MENLNDFIREKGIILIVILGIGAIIFVKYSDRRSKNEREYLKFNGAFAIGEFTDRSYYSTNGRVSSVGFEYVVNSKKTTGADTRCWQDSPKASEVYIDDKKADVGDKFLVLYDLNKPKKSIIRLDYPIKDSSDFKKYVKEFEEMRKQK